jgi:hypothetical protein
MARLVEAARMGDADNAGQLPLTPSSACTARNATHRTTFSSTALRCTCAYLETTIQNSGIF